MPETIERKEGEAPGGIWFKLPESNKARDILDKLMAENAGTVAYMQESNVYQAPEISRGIYPGYIAAILEALKNGGKVNTWELSREIRRRDGFINVSAWVRACQTIESQLQSLNEAITPEERADFQARKERDAKLAAGVPAEMLDK